MNVKRNDYQGLVNELQLVRGRNFSDNQAESLFVSFRSIDWYAACRIVRSISRQANLPNNLYGCVIERIDQEKYEAEKRAEKNNKWEAQENCITPEEWNTGMACLSKAIDTKQPQDWFIQFAESCNEAIGRGCFLNHLKSTLAILTA
jgi:hypothetical protein